MKGRNFIKSLRLFEALKLSLTDRELHQGVVILARGGVTEETMARHQMLHEGRWKIKHNGQHSKPYHSQTAALKDAIDQAHEVHKKGGLSRSRPARRLAVSRGADLWQGSLSARGIA
jgi:hypothetical protein